MTNRTEINESRSEDTTEKAEYVSRGFKFLQHRIIKDAQLRVTISEQRVLDLQNELNRIEKRKEENTNSMSTLKQKLEYEKETLGGQIKAYIYQFEWLDNNYTAIIEAAVQENERCLREVEANALTLKKELEASKIDCIDANNIIKELRNYKKFEDRLKKELATHKKAENITDGMSSKLDNMPCTKIIQLKELHEEELKNSEKKIQELQIMCDKQTTDISDKLKLIDEYESKRTWFKTSFKRHKSPSGRTRSRE